MKDKKLNLDRRQLLLTGAAAVVAPAVLITPAFAITPDEIKKRGKVIIGIQGDNPPWGYVEFKRQTAGPRLRYRTAFRQVSGRARRVHCHLRSQIAFRH